MKCISRNDIYHLSGMPEEIFAERSKLGRRPAVNAMTWGNPSPEEAAEEYYNSKSRYTDAANQRAESMRQEEGFRAERQSALNQLWDAQNQKLNFEKRLEQLREIIAMLTGSSGRLDVPGIIQKMNQAAEIAGESYRDSVLCADISAAGIGDVYRGKSVPEDPDTSTALDELQKEAVRLENAIEELRQKMIQLESLAADLANKISQCAAMQADLRRVMYSSAYDMNHFKGFM